MIISFTTYELVCDFCTKTYAYRVTKFELNNILSNWNSNDIYDMCPDCLNKEINK